MNGVRIFLFVVLAAFSSNVSAEVDKKPEPAASPADVAATLSKKPSEQGPMPNAACPECVAWLRSNKSLVESESRRAMEEFPIFAYSFVVLLDEYEYLIEFGTEGRASRTGGSQAQSVADIVHPDEIWNWIYQERRDLLAKLAELLAEMPDEDEPQTVDPKWTYCNKIEREYRAAQECVQNYLANPPQTEEEWAEYQGCLDAIQAYIDARDFCDGYW